MTKEEFKEKCYLRCVNDSFGHHELCDFDIAWELIEQLQDQIDANYMTYLSQVSLYKSLYEEHRKVDEEKLDKLADNHWNENRNLYDDVNWGEHNEIFKDGYRIKAEEK